MPLTFAIPGDIETVTGGYIYERRLLGALHARGHDARHLALPAGFPDPSPREMGEAVDALAALPPDAPLLLDGLVFGAIDPEGLARVRAPICAMIHHPLAHESGLSPARRAHLLATEAANLRLAAHVAVPSPHTAAVLRSEYGVPAERVSVAPPGFDPATGERRESRPPLILSVGILHPRKGHDVLLDALARLADLDWQAVIVGAPYDPAHAEALHRRRRALGLDARVRFAGLVSDGALHDLYRSAALLALATRYEGYGMVFGEALRHGLPIVSCRTGAVPDTVPESAGLLVPPGEPDAFAGALRRALSDDALREGLARGSAKAGARLPGWPDTAEIVGAALDRLAAR